MDTPAAVVEPPPTAPASAILNDDRHCVQCSYNLRGLPYAGNCPECGTPVENSLRGILLQYASPDYLKSVHQGLSLVLNGILLMIVFGLVGVFIGLAAATGVGAAPAWLPLVTGGLGLIPSVMMLLGYWKYTDPDPSFVGTELPKAARKVMRVTVVIQALTTAISFVFQLAAGSMSTGGANSSSSIALDGLFMLIGLVSMGAWIVQFFATMKYTGWLASRVPDAHIVKRSRTYMWLLPVVAIVGAILLFLGPLIALVMYWNLLDRLRKQVKAIRATGAPAPLKGSLG
jgi:hypothetical protein